MFPFSREIVKSRPIPENNFLPRYVLVYKTRVLSFTCELDVCHRGWVNVCARTCLSASTALERKKNCVDRQRVIPIDHTDIRYPVVAASFIWSQTSCKLDLLLRLNYIRYSGILVIRLRLFAQIHIFMNVTRQI